MALRTAGVGSDIVRSLHMDYGFRQTLSTTTVGFFTVTQPLTSSWCSSSNDVCSDTQDVAEGYRTMGPTNSQLARAFSPKVRRSWPDW